MHWNDISVGDIIYWIVLAVGVYAIMRRYKVPSCDQCDTPTVEERCSKCSAGLSDSNTLN